MLSMLANSMGVQLEEGYEAAPVDGRRVTRASAPAPAELLELRAQIDKSMGQLPLADGAIADEVDANGVPSIVCRRVDEVDGVEGVDGKDDPLIVYFHGGGYRLGSALAWRSYATHLAAACRARVLLVDYRLAPEHPFPAAVEDARRAYRWAVETTGDPSAVVVGGDSAGGGLAAALVVSLAGRGEVLPAGAFCLSPWADLTNTAATFTANAERDTLFSKAAAEEAAALYVGDGDRTDPTASPVFGSWPAQVPLLIQVGDTEVLLEDAAMLAKIATDGGADAVHHVFPKMLHVWQLQYPNLPDAVTAVDEIAAFVDRVAAR
jgi:acetyl esterase/lipase